MKTGRPPLPPYERATSRAFRQRASVWAQLDELAVMEHNGNKSLALRDAINVRHNMTADLTITCAWVLKAERDDPTLVRGCAWDVTKRDRSHRQAAAESGIPVIGDPDSELDPAEAVDTFAKGVMTITPRSVTIMVQTPAMLSKWDIARLERAAAVFMGPDIPKIGIVYLDRTTRQHAKRQGGDVC